jgi:Tol biopolymer transport system component
MVHLLACLVLAANPPADWEKQESTHLKNIRQVTQGFVRAGEGYFSPDAKQIIFQAEERGTDNPFYQIFVQDLATGRFRRVSPGIGKTTCAYFRPDGKKIIFASTHLDPDAREHYTGEYQRRAEERKTGKRRRYLWDFDPYMTIFEANLDGSGLKRLTKGKGYNAEGSYSPDGKHIVFCSNRSGEKDLELYIMDADGSNVRQLTHSPGCYNGGPFFSPDGKRVIFRSDRKKKDHLQLFVINSDGTGERALTDNLGWIFWAPYWYKDGKHIVYTAADHTNPLKRPNYDLYWTAVDGSEGLARDGTPAKAVRLTYFEGADVLPVFSPDGRKILWTSTRGGNAGAQLFIADFTPPKD